MSEQNNENLNNVLTIKNENSYKNLINITVSDNLLSKEINLQERFKNFRKERSNQLKNNLITNQLSYDERNNPERLQQLREKFIAGCKKYQGVPQARKQHEPGSEQYNAPLYLDCCALVKQVIQDLKEDFGFTLARQNQAQQQDTLPTDIKEDEMKPGDLIFISGTYFNEKSRKHAHDMVHVEIYIGPEEQCIGARWQRGVCQLFDSYKFISKSYYNMQYQFKSIDTWLLGICKSHCIEHLWIDDRKEIWLPNTNKSIFQNDESAEDELDDEYIENNDEQKNSKVLLLSLGSGNNIRLIKDALLCRNWKLLPDSYKNTDNFDFRWTQTTQEINFYAFKEGKQLVNHIRNNKILSTKTGLYNIIQDLKTYQLKDNMIWKNIISKIDSWFPVTQRTDKLTDANNICKLINNNKCFIIKPYGSNCGRGIKIISNVELIKDMYQSNDILSSHFDNYVDPLEKINDTDNKYGKLRAKCNYHNTNPNIVSEQISDCYLINNKKFDIRCYMLIARTKPYVVQFHHGYLRLSLENYNTNIPNHDDEKMYDEWWNNQGNFIHLTNNAIQKKHHMYKINKEKTILNMNQFKKYINNNDSDNKSYDELLLKLKAISYALFKGIENKLERKYGTFELFGLDFLVDSKLNPWLLEVNMNPALFTDTNVQKEIIPDMIDTAIEKVLVLHKDIIEEKNSNKWIDKKCRWELLYDEKMRFDFTDNI